MLHPCVTLLVGAGVRLMTAERNDVLGTFPKFLVFSLLCRMRQSTRVLAIAVAIWLFSELMLHSLALQTLVAAGRHLRNSEIGGTVAGAPAPAYDKRRIRALGAKQGGPNQRCEQITGHPNCVDAIYTVQEDSTVECEPRPWESLQVSVMPVRLLMLRC